MEIELGEKGSLIGLVVVVVVVVVVAAAAAAAAVFFLFGWFVELED